MRQTYRLIIVYDDGWAEFWPIDIGGSYDLAVGEIFVGTHVAHVYCRL